MLNSELTSDVLITRVSNTVAAGTTAASTSVVDMKDFQCCTFVCGLGTVTDGSVITLTAYENTASSTSGGTAVTNGATGTYTSASGSNTDLVIDVIRPKNRYLYATLTRTAQNAIVESMYALQYRGPTKLPVSQNITNLVVSSPEA